MASFEDQWIPLGDALAAYIESRTRIGVWFIEKHFENGAEKEVPTLTWSPESQTELNRSLSQAASLGEISLRGVKVKQRDAPQYGSPKDIPADYFHVTRCFVEQRNEIEPFSGEESPEAFAAARELGKRNPKWINVVIKRASFESWLKGARSITRQPVANGNMIAIDRPHPPNRPPEKREATIEVLKQTDQALLNGKREALLEHVNTQLSKSISKDTLRRALKSYRAEG